MGLVVSDLSYSTVAGAPSPALSGTSVTVSAGHGARFPAAPFYGYAAPSPSGTGSILSGSTSVVITHNIGVAPALQTVNVTLGELSTNDPGQIYVDTITSTQFTVRCRNNPGVSNLDFAWQVLIAPTRDTAEKVLVTAKATDVFTIVRAQGDTTAKSIAVGWSFYESAFDTVIEFGTADLYYNVAHYGGKGDDATDCTAAVNAAITAMPSNGGTLFFPQGTWRVGAPAATAKPVHVMGAGRNVTAIKQTNATANLFEFTGSGAGISDCTINTSVTKSAGAFMLLSAATRNNFCRDVIMSGAFYGVRITGAAVLTYLDRVDIQDCIASTGVGVSIEAGNDTYLNRVIMDKAAGGQPLAGIQILNSAAVWITDCDVIRSGTGLLVNPGVGQIVSWLFVLNSAFDTCSTRPLHLNAGTATSTIKGVVFNSCWFASSVGTGIQFDGHASGTLDGVRFEACRIFNNGTHGVLVSKGTNFAFDDCDIAGNSAASSGVSHGIAIASGIGGFSIRGSRIGQQAGFGNTQVNGILLNGTNDNYVVEGNDLRGNTAALADGNTAATTRLIRNNIGYVTENAGTGSIASGTTSAVITHGLSLAPSLKDVSITLGELSTTDPGQIYVDTFTATQFTVRCRTNPGASNLDFAWRVAIR